MSAAERRYRAGEPISDLCRACKTARGHTVMAVDGAGRVLRVMCDYCGSQHNYRGGGDEARAAARPTVRATPSSASTPPRLTPRAAAPDASVTPSGAPSRPALAERAGERAGERAVAPATGEPLPLVSERERTGPVTNASEGADLELLLRRVIREELGLTPVVPAEKWRGGEIVLRPGKPGLQEKRWPIETFFHKVVMIRNRLRTLEQQVNAADLPEDAKVRLQAYVSACYGSLTSFNLLFAEEEDQFKGSGSGE